jgi:hypothetical protein
MSARPDVEELQTTKSEKLLAVVLTAFLLLGGIWTYTRIDDAVRAHVPLPSASADPATRRSDAAQQRVFRAQQRVGASRQNLELSREAYRTALDADKPAADLERRYQQAQHRYEQATTALAAARREAVAAAPAAEKARVAADSRIDAARHRQERDAFLARLALVLLSIGGAYWLLAHMRRRQTRWFPLAGSAVAFATIFAFVLACDYLTDYFDPFRWGVALVAVVGISATLVAYLALERYLRRRAPRRRVRRHQCPFCAYPLGGNEHCEGCGRTVVAACTACEAPRRVGTAYCGACGASSRPKTELSTA